MSKLNDLYGLGQAIWYDNIRRSLIDSGELQALLDSGVVGVTSNPSIFEKAIAGSADYDGAIRAFSDGMTAKDMYEALAVEDISRTADLLLPVFDATDRVDGYISLEVSPDLAHDTAGTVAEGLRLFEAIGRPNVMIKVPATPEGIPAIEALICKGVNVNVTLIFSIQAYDTVAEAYLSGLEAYAEAGGDLSKVASVASFFVSRVDVAVDAELEKRGNTDLAGRIATANAKVAYARYLETIASDRWVRLAAMGARPQRILWASTGTKNPAYSDTLYLDGLIGADTVNTVPPSTLALFQDHGVVALTLPKGLNEARDQLARLAAVGIDLEAVTADLQRVGVASFSKAFAALLESVVAKRAALGEGAQRLERRFGPHAEAVERALERLKDQEIMRRIWALDHTVWSDDPTEIGNRLGWLTGPEVMAENIERLREFRDRAVKDGFDAVVLMGMGGSSLAPEGFGTMFGGGEGTLQLTVIDSTDPDMIVERTRDLDLDKTLFIVATKSGGTTETLSAFKYFYNRLIAHGTEQPGVQFVAVTDPGSKLEELAQRFGFRATFLNDPNIGGRYSALSFFGMVPGILVGVDVATLVDRAARGACNSESANCAVYGDNDAALLGAFMGAMAEVGRDKLTITSSPELAPFADWVEQLIAESTGKDGKGIVPVVHEPLGGPEVYGADRLFVDLRLRGDSARDETLEALSEAGHPILVIHLEDRYDLGGQYFLWEMATAVAGALLGIHPFNQPNVEAAKIIAREMTVEYLRTGTLPDSQLPGASTPLLEAFLNGSRAGDYVAIQAYVNPTVPMTQVLDKLRRIIRDHYHVATTVGYGPRFLHSTGQLHKGDGGNGLFVQLVSKSATVLDIPDEVDAPQSSMTFQVLKRAQALGDAKALLNAERRLLQFELGDGAAGELADLAATLGAVLT